MKKRDIGAELIEAVSAIKGGKGKRYVVGLPSNVKTVREKLHLSQMGLASLLGVSIRTLQAWEQGQRNPSGAALALLTIASAKPKMVRDVLRPIG